MIPLTEAEWQQIATVVSKPSIADALIQRAMKTPYFHLDGYMERWWLFNPMEGESGKKTCPHPGLPQIRIHHILRPDLDRFLHNHPFNARSIILGGWYLEQREDGMHTRSLGDTFEIGADTFHSIEMVSEGGVWTMFITDEWQHVWGFKTDNGFVPWRDFLGIPEGVEG